MSSRSVTNFSSGILAGTLVWVIITVCLLFFVGRMPDQLLSFESGEFLSQVFTSWVAIGGILGLGSLISFLGFISELSGRRGF